MFGYPLQEFKNLGDRFDEQESQIIEFGHKFVKPIEDMNSKTSVVGYDIIHGVIDDKANDFVTKQVFWLIGSFGLTIVISFFHLRSILLATFGVLGVFCFCSHFISYCSRNYRN